MATTQSGNSLELLFYPRNIAVIGASNTVGKLGYNVFKNLLSHNYAGKLYPINPGSERIQGIQAYKDITDIEEDLDEAVIIVPARNTPQVIKKCCEKGVKFVINEVAGFSEIGKEGREIELEIKEYLKNSGTRMVGPNCSGLINTHHDMVQSLGIVGPLKRGNIGLIAQAGVYAAGFSGGSAGRWASGLLRRSAINWILMRRISCNTWARITILQLFPCIWKISRPGGGFRRCPGGNQA